MMYALYNVKTKRFVSSDKVILFNSIDETIIFRSGIQNAVNYIPIAIIDANIITKLKESLDIAIKEIDKITQTLLNENIES